MSSELSSSHVFLIDFDIARSAILETIAGSVFGSRQYVGTPEYSAPEQSMQAGKVTPFTDIFSLGLVLYELATNPGVKAFPSGNEPQTYGDRLPPIKKYGILDSLYEILSTLLQQEPSDRMSADTLYKRLQTCLATLEGNN
jgi:serine/threonine protein kinase